MIRTRTIVLALAFALPACSYDSTYVAEAWGSGRFEDAEAAIDELLAEQSGTDVELVRSSNGLAVEIDAAKGESALLLLEKGTARLAARDYDSAIDCLRKSRDVLEDRFNANDVAGWLTAALGDDRALDFVGADYEHLMIPTMLSIVDLLSGGRDKSAYAFQIGELQEAILGSSFGENLDAGDGTTTSYNPRKQYQRVAIGAYMEGLVQEAKFAFSEAARAYTRAADYSGHVDVVDAAVTRTTSGVYAPPGHGVVHVFYLAGRSPAIVTGTSPITEQAMLLANVGSIVIGQGVGVLGQSSVPIPVVQVRDGGIAPLDIRGPDAARAVTSPLLDLNVVAVQQIEANLPWIIARAALRRAAKAVASKAVQDTAGKQDEVLGFLAGIVSNAALTWWERADTRSWVTLPAQIQVARLEVPEGTHTIDLGPGMSAGVRVAAGKDSYVVVVRPALGEPGRVLVDVYSRATAGAAPVDRPAAPETTAAQP